jgi:hypothetical protein
MCGRRPVATTRRRPIPARTVRGCFPRCIIGLTFVKQTTAGELSLTGVAGYAVGGALLYLLSAARLHLAARSAAGRA